MVDGRVNRDNVHRSAECAETKKDGEQVKLQYRFQGGSHNGLLSDSGFDALNADRLMGMSFRRDSNWRLLICSLAL